MDIQALLDEAYERFAVPGFIAEDPVQIPRSFSRREDAETIGFLTATIAWGQRPTILRNAWALVDLMDRAPHDFIMHAGTGDLCRLRHFVHRTFNGVDLHYFVLALRHVYQRFGDLESAFLADGVVAMHGPGERWNAMDGIRCFREHFFALPHPSRTEKHVSDPGRGSSAKRINMFLRWMVRPDDRGVDLGLWERIRTADLMMPLDVHTGRVSRALGLLQRTQDDRRAVEELTGSLRAFDPDDPVKYDIALFGMGVEAGRLSR